MGKNRPTKKKSQVERVSETIYKIGSILNETIKEVSEKSDKREVERMKIENSKDTISIIHTHNSEGMRDTKVEISFSKETSKELKSILRELKVN